MLRLMVTGVVAIWGAALIAGAGEPAKPDSPLVGLWRLKSVNGDPPLLPQVEEFDAKGRHTIRTGHESGQAEDRGHYLNRPDSHPAQIDYIMAPTSFRRSLIGIYKVEGHVLTICYRTAKDGKRPQGFDKAGEGNTVFVYDRTKKD